MKNEKPLGTGVEWIVRWLLVLAASMIAIGSSHAQITLSEFLAVPGPGTLDDDGDPSGWIEISNVGSASVSLTGFYLTDDAANLTLWELPAASLAAGGSMVIWASGKDRASAAAPLHTSFTLEGAGGYLALVEADGVTIASEFAPGYPQQLEGISYGRSYSGGAAAVDLVPYGSTANFLVPTDGSLGDSWRQAPGTFDDSSWASAVAPIGYGSVAGQILATPGLQTMMRGVNPTCYVRFPFVFDTSSNSAQNMTLDVIIDDGFVAYINGVEVASYQSPPSPTWNSTAQGSAEGELVSTAVAGDLSALLVDGANVLAIQGMNVSLGSSDFMVEAELKATVQDVSGGLQAGYFETPTPGQINGATKDGQVITFDPLADVPFGSAPINLVATSTSGLAVDFEVVSGNATVSGAALTLTGTGAVTVRAVQTGDLVYIAAAPVERSFTVTAGSQTIDFPAVGTRNFGDEAFAPVVSAGSG